VLVHFAGLRIALHWCYKTLRFTTLDLLFTGVAQRKRAGLITEAFTTTAVAPARLESSANNCVFGRDERVLVHFAGPRIASHSMRGFRQLPGLLPTAEVTEAALYPASQSSCSSQQRGMCDCKVMYLPAAGQPFQNLFARMK
jgi:hypothetical protein